MSGSFMGDLRRFWGRKGLGSRRGRLTVVFDIRMASQQLYLPSEAASALCSLALRSELVLVNFLTVS